MGDADHIKAPSEVKQSNRKSREGVVYSTNPDFNLMPDNDDITNQALLTNKEQSLRVSCDKRNRRGKTVTLVGGFIGPEQQLEALARLLKLKCGVGGSVKDGEIVLQGDFRQKALEILQKEGYSKSKII
jgi:translation initiation factor 1